MMIMMSLMTFILVHPYSRQAVMRHMAQANIVHICIALCCPHSSKYHFAWMEGEYQLHLTQLGLLVDGANIEPQIYNFDEPSLTPIFYIW